MTRLMLDTSAYSALLRGHPAVCEAVRAARELLVNPVVLGEPRAGFRGGRHERRNEELLGRFLTSSRVGILPIDEESSQPYAAICRSLLAAGTPIPTNDLWIAATAMQHGLTVLTLDDHFAKVPQILVNVVTP
ncbi:MAG: type II toxin-antitoxin system VapC family toxin [Candidatus Riflebacteria bacterium]|nr:type II toxin-antitoxin system VapC family toxin [Candidatus Riflebacteria bacterium]